MRRTFITSAVAISALLATSLAQPAAAGGGHGGGHGHGHHGHHHDSVFIEGGVMAGSTNGISFAPDGTLWIANVIGGTITQIDPESGEILSRLTSADGVIAADDVIVGPDYTIYWTEIALGSVFKKPLGEPAVPLVDFPFGLNSANPLTLSDDGRLWAAGCYGGPPENNDFVEIDPVNGGILKTLREDIPGCASNGMSWNEGFLYSPQPFTDEILRLDPDSDPTEIEVVTSGWSVPIGTAFDSSGNLFALAQGAGEVVRIDLDNDDTENNREVIAEIPVGWADNIAILPVDGGDDRIFISSASDSVIAEVLPDGSLRTVVPGQFQIPFGVGVIDDTLYTSHLGGVVGFDRKTGDQTSHFRAPFGVAGFPATTSMVAWGDNLVLMSILSGQISIWDPETNTAVAEGLLFSPIDAQPFRGDLIVTQGNGEIVRVSDQLVPIEVVATVEGATGLARRGSSVYVADHDDGAVLRIMKRGKALATPEVVVDGLAGPEGLDIRGNSMYVVEGAAQSLTKIDLRTGRRSTVGDELGFQEPNPISTYGWFNDVTVSGNEIYVNADRANVIHEFHRSHRHGWWRWWWRR
jgi:sugar lactone lactonase YvrE